MTGVQFQPVERRYRGGQGEVWIAKRLPDGARVALKYMHTNPASANPEADLKRFRREIRSQSTLSHPNIAPVIAHNMTVTPPWYAMPWADGTLRGEIEAHPQGLVDADALRYMRSIIAAISYAHSEGVCHRDLKPENVLLIEGEPIVSDFGLSRLMGSDSATLTMTGTVVGTLAYAAPEQFTDAHDADERADVYALGKILYELLTGLLPFPALKLDRLAPQYRYIVARCTEEAPADRYSTVDELARELGLLEVGSAVLDPPLARANGLLDDFVADRKPKKSAERLVRLLVENAEDEVLYTQFVPRMPESLVTALVALHMSEFRAILRRFDDYVSGSLGFSYTDTVANFLALVFAATPEPRIRNMVLARLLDMGYSHNRFHVGEVFARLVRSESDPSHTLMVAAVLRDNPKAAEFAAEYMRADSLPAAIREALDGA